jgi:Flp pilus assembly protein TadD
MPRRRIVLLFGLALALLQPGCLTPGDKLAMAQKPREPVALPPAQTAELSLAVADQMTASGHFPEAAHHLTHVRHLNPKADVSGRLARLYARMGKDQLALAEFDAAVKAHPRDAALWNDLGYYHYERGNWAEAERALRKALELEPEHQKAWTNLGLALGQAGKYQEALVAFEQVVRPAEARCNLAFVMNTQGKRDEARQLYQEALDLDGSLKLARTMLAKLDNPTPRPVPAPSLQQVPKPAPPPDGPIMQASAPAPAARAAKPALAMPAPPARAPVHPAPMRVIYPEP